VTAPSSPPLTLTDGPNQLFLLSGLCFLDVSVNCLLLMTRMPNLISKFGLISGPDIPSTAQALITGFSGGLRLTEARGQHSMASLQPTTMQPGSACALKVTGSCMHKCKY
jgi:hypothetical protein